MYKSPSKKNRVLRRVLTYGVMTIGIVTIVTLLVLIMLGYRFNRDTSMIQQGGLVQFASQPNGSNVRIGTANLTNLTPSKITMNPGNYDVTMNRSGYREWSKNVDVRSGQVLWLNYARLMPESIETEEVQEFQSIAQVKSSPDGERMALLKERRQPAMTIVRVVGDEPETTDIEIPAELLPEGSVRYDIESWSFDSRRLLITATVDEATEWLMVDRADPDESVNLSESYDDSIDQARFDPRGSDRVVYVSQTDQLRLIDSGSDTLSPVLANDVVRFSYFNDDAVFFVQSPSADVRRIAYLSFGQDEIRELKRLQTGEPVFVDVATYFGDPHVLTTVGRDMSVERLSRLPSSASDDPIQMTRVSDRMLASQPRYVSLRSGGRFAVAQYDRGVATYDVELDRSTITNLKRNSSELRWLDRYHFYVTDGDSLRIVEFDGANPGVIAPLATRFDSVLTSDGRYAYSVDRTEDDTYVLQRSRLILE